MTISSVRAAGFDDQPFGEAGFGDRRGGFARADVDAAHHPAAAGRELMLAGHALEPPGEHLAAPLHIVLEGVGGPEVAQRRRRGDERMVVAAEGAVVLAGAPHVEFGAEQGQRKR